MQFDGLWGILTFAAAVLIVLLVAKGALKAFNQPQLAAML